MSNMDDAKKTYDAIEIPEELSERVQEAIRISQRKQKSAHMRNRKKIFVRSMETAAALAIGFTVLLNANTAFAKEMSEIPVWERLRRCLPSVRLKRAMKICLCRWKYPRWKWIRKTAEMQMV